MPPRVVRSTIQAGALSALSNFLAQFIRCQRSGIPFTLDAIDLLRFVTFSIIMCPPNVIWQTWLEAHFPAYTEALSPTDKGPMVDEETTGGGTGTELKDNTLSKRGKRTTGPTTEKPLLAKRLDIKNTASKVALDQTIGAAVNTILFIIGISLLRGHDWASALSDVQTKFWPTTFAGQKLWPAVSILSYTVIPFEQRMLFGSVAGLFWGVYLSLVAGAKRP